MKDTYIAGLIVVAFLSGMMLSGSGDDSRITGNTVFEVSDQLPETQYFHDKYNFTESQAYILSRQHVKESKDELREQCGPSFSVQRYWKVSYDAPASTKQLVMWIDPETREVACINQDFLITGNLSLTEMERGRETIQATEGDRIKEDLYFYSLRGQEPYYVSVEIVDQPGWAMEVEPSVRTYEPSGKPPVRMNVQLQPHRPTLTRSETPEDVSYIEVDGVDGYVRASHVGWRIRVPTTDMNPQKKLRGEFPVTLRVTFRQYRDGGWQVVDQQDVEYTIDVN